MGLDLNKHKERMLEAYVQGNERQGTVQCSYSVNWSEIYLKKAKQYKNIIDIGCGDGSFCVQCAELNNIEKVYGLDAASVANKHVLKHNKIEYFDSWAWEIPLPDNSVDAIVTCEVLEHIPEEYVRKTFEEFHRVVKHAVYGTIATKSSGEKYSDGTNAHMCVQNKLWWRKQWEKSGFKTKGTTPSKNSGINFTITKNYPKDK